MKIPGPKTQNINQLGPSNLGYYQTITYRRDKACLVSLCPVWLPCCPVWLPCWLWDTKIKTIQMPQGRRGGRNWRRRT